MLVGFSQETEYIRPTKLESVTGSKICEINWCYCAQKDVCQFPIPIRSIRSSSTSSPAGKARTQRRAEAAEELPEASVKDTGPVHRHILTFKLLYSVSPHCEFRSHFFKFLYPDLSHSPSPFSLLPSSTFHILAVWTQNLVFSLSLPVTSHTKLEASS